MNEAPQNPLLALPFDIPFAAIRGEHVEPAVAALLQEARARLDALVAEPGPRTYANTLGALEDVTEGLDLAMNVVSHLESTSTTPELRAAYNAVQPDVSAFLSSIVLSEGVYRALRAFAGTDEARALTGTRKRFLDKTLADFRRSGAELDPAGKERLAAIDVELATVTLRYGHNVLDATNAFEIVLPDASRLAGMPAGAIEAARESARAKGLEGYRLTLQAPSYLAVMTYCDDAALREAVYRAFSTRAASGEHDNRGLVAQIIGLRREKAALLGFASFADLVLDDRMARTGARARELVTTLREKAEHAALREHEDLVAFRRSIEGDSAPALAPWDIGYYAEKLRKARFDFDDEMLRPYFPLDRALKGAFAVVERLYGVHVEPWEGASVWHPSVLSFRLREPDGSISAHFHVDVFPRESKRDGAWMHGLITGVAGDARGGRHLEVLAGNFAPPVGDTPALLNHRELETLFHELGHLLHHASSHVDVRSLGGTNVAWDFVELPSQIMENFCWEPEALDLFARHYLTGDAVPRDMQDRMRAARTFRAATAIMRQVGFAELDLALHMEWDPEAHGDPVSFARDILERHSSVPLPPDHAFVASFSHLFSSPVGYAAGYYSYKWAEVLDADAFSRFKREGVFNRDVGLAFRASILARGDSDDPAELYRLFMGRDPTIDPLLERDGLLAPTEARA